MPPLSTNETSSPQQHNNALRLRNQIRSLSYIPPGASDNRGAMLSGSSGSNKGKSLVARSLKDGRKPPVMNQTRLTPKRAMTDDSAEVDYHPVVKKRRSTTKERSAGDPHNVENKLVDSLRPGLVLVFIGLNPGLTTAATGHAYAHSSNLFWKLLHWSEVTPILHAPSDTRALMDLYSIGNTNICARPTRTGDGLAKQELEEGAVILEEKIREFKPETVCIVGKGIWDTIYKVKTGQTLKKGGFKYGWQDEEMNLGRSVDRNGVVEWPGSKTFVATTTSGLAAGMSKQEKIDVWVPLGQWLQQRRGTLLKREPPAASIKTELDGPDVKVEDIEE